MTNERDHTQESLLDAAEALFSEKGYDGVGIRQIVQQAGANIAAINYHFGSKAALYLATVRRAMERKPSEATWAVLEGPHDTPQDAARALAIFVRGFLRHLLMDEQHVACCFIMHEAAEPSEACDSIVREFILPSHEMLKATIAVLKPEATSGELDRDAWSVMGQILWHRTFRPFIERMDGECVDEHMVGKLAEHILEFSLRGMGCSRELIQEAIAVDAGREGVRV